MESLKYVRDYKVAPLLNSMVLHLLVTKPPTDREILGSLIDYLAALEEDGDYKERVVNRRISIHRQPAKPRRREPSKDDDASKSEAEGKPPATSNGAAADGEAKAEDLKEDTKEDSVNDDPSQEGATNGTKPDDDADESKDESKHDAKEESKDDAKDESKDDAKEESKDDAKEDAKDESKDDAKDESKEESKDDAKEESKEEESKEEPKEEEARAAEPKAEEMASRAAPTPLARVSGTLIVTVVRARDVPDLDAIGGSDPYCVLRCTEGDAQEQRTAVKSDATDPVWDERFTFAIRDSAAQRIAVRMLDEDTFSDAPIAEGTVGLGDLTDGEDTERWVALGGEHGTVQVLVRLRAEGFGEVPPVTNRAFLFVKPHAVTHPTLQLVEARMAEAGLRVLRRGSVPAQRIDEEGIIDRHYSAIARYALQWGADELVLDRAAKEKFSAAFGVSWNDAVEAGDVLNAGAAMKRGVAGATTPEALGEAWDAAETKTKLMPGLYAGRLADKYVCNGFYPRNRAKFTAPGSEVQWYDVEWDEAAMTWAAFRGDFLGPTDPARAAPGSLRGTILRDWEALGLSAAPSVSDNGVHASAGPVEGMVERHVWLEQPRESDPFARLCTTRGVGADVVDRVAANAEITVDGRTAPAFDLLEDVQTSAVLEMLREAAVPAPKEDNEDATEVREGVAARSAETDAGGTEHDKKGNPDDAEGSKDDAKEESKDDAKEESKDDSKDDDKEESKEESKEDDKEESKEESKDDDKEESKEDDKEPKEEAQAAEHEAEEVVSRAAPTPPARVSGTLVVTVVRARDVPDLDAIGGSDPYCVLRCTDGDAQEQRTAVKSDATDPVWDERFTFAIHDCAAQRIAVRMLDEDTFSDAPIAEGTVGLGDLTDGEDTERWVALAGEHGTVQVLVRLRAEGFGEVPPVTNRAFLFVKPHAVTHPTLQLVEARMAEAGLRVLRRGSVPAQRIDEEGIIDRHYSAIARYALQWGADELVLDRAAKEKFSAAFGVSWNDAVEADDVLNAGAAMKRGVAGATTPEALGEAWDAAETKTKLMPGLYAGRLADKYVCNGFYPRNRAKFTAPGSEVQWYDVEWDEAAMTWAAFRGDFLGPTDPARAAPGSLRGTILRDWEALGLSAAPSVSDNGVHASAGPVEGMVERHVWLEQPRESDPFARLCTTRGVGADVVDRVAANAEITVDGRTAPAFDLLEDVQTSAVLEMLRSMAP